MLVGWFLGFLVKLLVQRARPVVSDPVSHAPGYSFPSGHAFNAALATTVVLILLWPLLGATARRVGPAVGAVVVPITCLDRVFLGVHFPSDVVGGVILALALAGASYVGYRGPRRVARDAAPPTERSTR
jgi:undecaprenyl-diphosphatase